MDRRAVFTLVLLVATSGCTHVQLRRNTVRQALTVADIQQQQVLNNLAMFVVDPNALPTFSYPNQSSSNVTDTGTASIAPGAGRSTGGLFWFNSLAGTLTGERQMAEAFTLNPVNDPRKLELMRCAYQKAVSGCGGKPMSEACPDCKSLQQRFYTGDPDNPEIAEAASGIVTSECLHTTCWFCWGPKKCVPKDCDCMPVGHYCGTWVWVPSSEGRNELTKLTLAILDYAQNSPPAPIMKTVSYYIDEYGLPTSQGNSVGSVSASVQISELPSALMNMGVTTPDEVRIKQILSARLLQINLELADLEQKMNAVKGSYVGGNQAPTGVEGAPKKQVKPAPGVPAKDKTLLEKAEQPAADVGQDSGAAPSAGSSGKSDSPGASETDKAKYTALLAEKQAIEGKLRYLGEQLRIEGLKHPYVPVGSPPAIPSSILPFQLQQQALGVSAPAGH
ncbi:MAG TPA: hypothetical protein VMF30_05000 [Pirellulales bacterium]|nr:hypothetical protein [Pirellulales bacterium]